MQRRYLPYLIIVVVWAIALGILFNIPIPPKPRLDLPFLVVVFGAVFFNITTVIYAKKASVYRRRYEISHH